MVGLGVTSPARATPNVGCVAHCQKIDAEKLAGWFRTGQGGEEKKLGLRPNGKSHHTEEL